MKHSNWKKYTLLLTSIAIACILGERLVQACADPGDPYDYYPSFFSNSVLNEKPYTPFFYTANLKYYDEWYDADTATRLPDQNIPEWRAYTGNTVPEADLDSFIYKYPYSGLSALYYNIEKGKPLQVSAAMAGNAFTKWFIANKDLEALGYLMYAKQCEPLAAGSGDYWSPAERDSVRLGRMERNGLKLHAAAKKDFFKWRYAYQVLRMAFYGGDSYENTLALYDQLIGTATAENIMYPRCLSIKAGALFRTGRKAEAAYLFSRVFDRSDEMKKTAYISYDWSNDSSDDAVLALCKNDHEKAVLYVMKGLNAYGDGLDMMQQACRLDPSVKGLNVLMTREINKLEERYLQDKLMQERNLNTGWNYFGYNYYSYDNSPEHKAERDSTAQSYKSYLKRLGDFAQKQAQDKKTNDKAFWNLSAAYISFLQDDAKACGKYLAKAEKAGMNNREHDQHDIIHILYTMKSNPELNAKTEAKILPELQWLDSRAAKNPAFQKPYRDFITNVLVTPYLKQGDTIKAVYCLARAVRNDKDGFTVNSDFTDMPGTLLERMTPAQLQQVEAFYRKKDKTAYDQWLTKNSPYDLATLYELEGTKYIRDYNFRDAVVALKKGNDFITLPNAFAAYTRDQLEYEEQDSVKVYTKLSYAEKMLALQQKLESNPKDAAAAFDYATGLYSISYYGKAHNAWTYYRGTSDGLAYYDGKERRALPDQVREFYEVKTAEKYFLITAGNTQNAELKAKALWMAAKCWQKRCPENNDNSGDDDDYYKYSLGNPYYKQLTSSAAGTKYYKEVWNTCSYFKDYLKRK